MGQVELSKTDHHPKVGAVACMNLATALLKLGGLANERKATHELLEASAKLRDCGNAAELQRALARRLLQLNERSPSMHDVLEPAMHTCHSPASRCEHAVPAVMPHDPEGH